MIRYYYTKLKLFFLSVRALRNQRKGYILRTKIGKLQAVIAAGFTNEKEFEEFNKRLTANRHKNELPPEAKETLDNLRKKHYNDWQPEKHFKDSEDKQAQQKGQQRSEFVRVLKNRPLKKNPDDLVTPSPQGDKGMLYPDERNRKENKNG